MIKFFRRIRQDLLSEGKSRTYLVYAIGEIALVMIGILLALQVNNWNENRKSNAYISSLIDAVAEDVESNIILANQRFNVFAQEDSIAKLIINTNLTKSDFLKDEALRITIIRFFSFRPVTDNTDKLLIKEESVPTKYKEVLSSIKDLKALMDEMNQDLDALDQNVNENFQYMTEKFGPYKKDSVSLAGRLDYYMTDEFKNKLNYMNIKREAYMFKIAHYRSISLWILTQLKFIKSQASTSQIISLFDRLNMIPFSKVDCHQESLSDEWAVRERFPILNLSDNEIRLKVGFQDDTESTIHILKPNEFFVTIPEAKPIDEDYTRTIEITKPNNDSCMIKYLSRKNGYLIIE